MMTLGEYLDSCLASGGEDRGDYRLALASLSAYAESRGGTLAEIPLLDLALPGWIDGYFEFLVADYESNKSRNRERGPQAERVRWAKRYLKCARKAVNRAIRAGLLPNIDFFAGISKAPDFARRQGVEEESRASAQLLALSKTKPAYRSPERRVRDLPHDHPDSRVRDLRSPASAPERRVRDLPHDHPDSRVHDLRNPASAPERRVRDLPHDAPAPADVEPAFGALDLYLLCMHCGGLELDELYALSGADIDPARGAVRLPWAGIELAVPQTVVSALAACRAMPQFGSRGPEVVAQALRAAGSALYGSGSVFADWLRFAKDQGVSDGAIARLVEARRNPGAPLASDLAEAVQTVTGRMGAHYNKYKKQWYCLYTHRSTGEDKYREMLASEAPPVRGMAGRSADFYYPDTSEISVRRVQGRRIADPRAVLRRYLFVCCSPYEIRKIDQSVAGVSILGRRRNGVKDYAVVSAAEIYTLRLMLESIRGTEAELMLEDEDIKAAIDTTPLQERERVRILAPAYQEYEAEVVKVRQNSYYTVQLSGIGKTFILKNVPRALIKRIA